MLKLLEGLGKSYTLLALTNICDEHVEILEDHNMQQYFKKIYKSNRMGLAKPNSKIYMEILRENNLKPEECIFIDDKPINIDGANEIGINAIRFKNQMQLEQRLKELNISWNR